MCFPEMKDDQMFVQFNIKAFGLGMSIVTMLVANTQCAVAGTIPYPSPGTLNATTYTFTASNTGEVIAYYAGSTASYDNQLGMLINGVQSSAGFGLDNHTSPLGLAFDLGHVTKGDTLVFDLKVISLGGLLVYSDPSKNSAYDNGGPGLNHVYSTPYSGGSLGNNIPDGTFVGFEDLRGGGDKNYNDEDFVFTNVASVLSSSAAAGVPEPSSIVVFGLGVIGLIGSAIRKERQKRKRSNCVTTAK